MKYCSNCGSEIKEGDIFCGNCGMKLGGDGKKNDYQQEVRVPNRNIAYAVIFTFLTCGIYGIYWFIMITDEVNSISDEKTASGALSFVFCLLTCGIYFIYWNYQMGKKLYSIGLKYHRPIEDNSIVYLLLSIFGLSIVSNCLIQNDLNQFS